LKAVLIFDLQQNFTDTFVVVIYDGQATSKRMDREMNGWMDRQVGYLVLHFSM
jgi:hypothetical protein